MKLHLETLLTNIASFKLVKSQCILRLCSAHMLDDDLIIIVLGVEVLKPLSLDSL